MPFIAATATPASPTTVVLLAVLAGLVWAAGYVVACALWPYTACRRCAGSPQVRSPGGKAWRLCRKCGGSGRRVRSGRRAYEYLRAGADKLK